MEQLSTAYRPKLGRPTRDQAQARDIALLDTALDLFLDLGFEQTTIDAIARTVGMTKRTLYARYPDKASLFHAAVRLAIDRFTVTQEQIEATDTGDLEQTLIAIAMLRIDLVRTPNGLKLQRIINTESYRFPEIFTDSYELAARPTVEFLAALLERETQAGRLGLAEPAKAAIVFMNMVVSGSVRAIVMGRNPSRAELEDATRYAVGLFLAGACTR